MKPAVIEQVIADNEGLEHSSADVKVHRMLKLHSYQIQHFGLKRAGSRDNLHKLHVCMR